MKVLPVHIDVGTNNKGNLADPAYLGLRQERVRGEAFFSLVAEFIAACQDKYGHSVLIQVSECLLTVEFECFLIVTGSCFYVSV